MDMSDTDPALISLFQIGSAAALLLALCGGCTITEGVVTDITPTENGFIVTKCDATVNYALIISQANCRNEQAAK